MVTMDVDGRCKKWSDVSLYVSRYVGSVSVFCCHQNGKGMALLAPPPAVGIFPLCYRSRAVRGSEDCNRNHYQSQSQSQIAQSADGLGRANEGVSSIA
jgi:hypothetical protein